MMLVVSQEGEIPPIVWQRIIATKRIRVVQRTVAAPDDLCIGCVGPAPGP
jgi:hypothetical protein